MDIQFMKNFLILFITLVFSQPLLALTPVAEAGKQLYMSCNACHNPDLNPPLAPPMFAVQKKYKRQFSDRREFVEKIVDFVEQPSKQASLFPMAIEKMGIMPTLGFPEQDLEKIAAFIYENEFGYPCGHWKTGMEMAKKSDDMRHYKKDKKKLERFCKDKKTPVTKDSMKPLKKLMQQLGLDFNQLSLAILAEDSKKIASSAHAIAAHPEVLPHQKKTLKAYFGKEMKLFKQADMKVHKLSSEIEKSAKENDLSGVVEKQGQLLQACMDCHQTFRKRAIKALAIKNKSDK